MSPEVFRRAITGGELSLPYVIKTKGGRSYTITHHVNAFISEAYPNTVVVCVREKGITLLGLESIDSIRHEPEVAAATAVSTLDRYVTD